MLLKKKKKSIKKILTTQTQTKPNKQFPFALASKLLLFLKVTFSYRVGSPSLPLSKVWRLWKKKNKKSALLFPGHPRLAQPKGWYVPAASPCRLTAVPKLYLPRSQSSSSAAPIKIKLPAEQLGLPEPRGCSSSVSGDSDAPCAP